MLWSRLNCPPGPKGSAGWGTRGFSKSPVSGVLYCQEQVPWQAGGGAAAATPQACRDEPMQALWPRAVRWIKSLELFIRKCKKLHLLGYKEPAKSPGFGLISKCFSIAGNETWFIEKVKAESFMVRGENNAVKTFTQLFWLLSVLLFTVLVV